MFIKYFKWKIVKKKNFAVNKCYFGEIFLLRLDWLKLLLPFPLSKIFCHYFKSLKIVLYNRMVCLRFSCAWKLIEMPPSFLIAKNWRRGSCHGNFRSHPCSDISEGSSLLSCEWNTKNSFKSSEWAIAGEIHCPKYS